MSEEIKVPELTHAQISERAYQIYLANGCKPGHAEDDWLQAQYELLQQPVGELAKLGKRKSFRIPKNAKLLVAVVQAALLLMQ